MSNISSWQSARKTSGFSAPLSSRLENVKPNRLGNKEGSIATDSAALISKVRATLGKMSTVISAIDEAIVWTDENGIVQWSNTRFDDLLEQPRLKVLGARLIDLLPPQSDGHPLPSHAHPIHLVLTTRHSFEGFYEFRRAERKHILEISGKWVPLSAEESAAVFVIRDVTKRRQAEEVLKETNEKLKAAQAQLVQAAKLESIGQLAAGAAHEVKNPLAILQQGVDYLSAKAKVESADPNVVTVLQEMTTTIAKADSVIRGLLDFARLSVLNLEGSDLAALIERALLLIKHPCDQSGVEVVKVFQTDLPAVKVDQNRIEQVFVNLLLNAVQAMLKGGKLWIKAYAMKLTTPGSGVGRRVQDIFRLGETIVIVEIEDTGSGIREDLLPKIFDPFFTTKRDVGGSGLGLAVVRNIMEMHGGTIEIRNRVEGGVKATLRLKVWQEKGENLT